MSIRTTYEPFNPKALNCPNHVFHESFLDSDATEMYHPNDAFDDPSYAEKYMPDDATRDHAKRMHYAAYRWKKAKSISETARWARAYRILRDRIVLGNRKLVYRAVRRKLSLANRVDDLIGDCNIVLIQAVAAFNPWMGIRFSTYAYTCLVRALSRIGQRLSNDWLSRSASLEVLPDGEPKERFENELVSSTYFRIDEYLREEHPLLSDREKTILKLRFFLNQEAPTPTLEAVGKELGLSKERVRQVQALALGKLRRALLSEKSQ
jgi:RNA polymerase sigma factor (sigma-70 family)